MAFSPDVVMGHQGAPLDERFVGLIGRVGELVHADLKRSPLAVGLMAALLQMRSMMMGEGAGPFFLGSAPGVAFALSFSTTAEHLADMYLAALARLDASDRDVAEIICGTGPGSFTGLRIGCSFANGLQAGRRRLLRAVPCHALVELRRLAGDAGMDGEWFQDFATLDAGKDESFARVGILDAMMAVAEMVGPNCETAEVLEPRYGKEPGPVIKLREQQSNLL
jgi:hypothetical protein